MLIYTKNNITYCYIHIPKNSGKYIRKLIKNDKECKIIKNYWNVSGIFDLAHIPYMLKNKYININNNINKTDKSDKIIYYSYSRNPYDRIISAFFYKNGKKSIIDFKNFVLFELNKIKFDLNFNSNIIHYYPQYLFIVDENLEISNVKIKKLKDEYFPKEYNLSEYYDNNMIKIINTIYELDFKLFDYNMIENI